MSPVQAIKNPTTTVTEYPISCHETSAEAVILRNNPGPGIGSLGKDANIVAKTDDGQYAAYKVLAWCQGSLYRHNVTNTSDAPHRTRFCSSVRAYQAETITLRLSEDPDNSRAALAGVQTCGSVWSCPVCSRRIALERAKEISAALDYARSENLTPIMLTLTARHDTSMALSWLQDRFRAAWRKMSQHRRYRQLREVLQIKHSIKATEITHGDNGWHYHSHGILFVPNQAIHDASLDELKAWQSAVESLWLHCLHDVGLSGERGIAANVSYHGDVKEKYLTKLGLNFDQKSNAKYELTSGMNKTQGGRNIWQIARSAMRGNYRDELLYIEYVQAMQGVNWITWSHGLKDLVGVQDIADDTISENDNESIFLDFLDITDDQFAPVRRLGLIAELLEVTSATRDVQTVIAWLAALDSLARANEHDAYIERLRAEYQDALARLRISQVACNRLPGNDFAVKRFAQNRARLQECKTALARCGERV